MGISQYLSGAGLWGAHSACQMLVVIEACSSCQVLVGVGARSACQVLIRVALVRCWFMGSS